MKDQIAGSLSRPTLIKVLPGLIVFFAATQLGLHFWPPSSFVYGIRIDYLAPTLYFLDILIILYLTLQSRQQLNALVHSPLLLLSIPIILMNLIFSANPLATLSWSLHFLLYGAFAACLSTPIISSLTAPIIAAISLQVLLALTQSVLGHNVGGLLYWVGERTIAVGQPNVASAQIFGETMLRAYGTFSHPNTLAGWLVMSLVILLCLMKKNKSLVIGITLALVVVGIMLTQSRAAGLSLFGVIIPIFLLRPKLRLPYSLGIVTFCLFFYPTLLSPSRADLSLRERLNLQKLSLRVIQTFPIFGTGANAAITTYPAVSPNWRLLQPDHNSTTLSFSWFGFFGLLAILSALKQPTWRIKPWLPLLPLLLLDHYLLTSPQGLFILVLYVRTCWLANKPVH